MQVAFGVFFGRANIEFLLLSVCLSSLLLPSVSALTKENGGTILEAAGSSSEAQRNLRFVKFLIVKTPPKMSN